MITGSLLEDEYLRAQKLYRAPFVTKIYLALFALVALGLVVKFYLKQDLLGLVLVCGGIGGFLGQLISSMVLLPRRARKIYQQNATYRSQFRYNWDNESLSVESDTGKSRRPWSNYVKFSENDYFFFLYHSDITFELLPKRWFQAPGQLEEFRRLASRIGT